MFTSNKHHRGVLLIVMLLIGHFAFAQSQFRFEHYTKKDGLGNDFAKSLAQDSLGYIWILYPGALSSFDGYNFKVYRHDAKNSLTSTLDFLMGTLFIDKANNIWVAPNEPWQTPMVVKFDRKTDGFTKYNIDMGGMRTSRITFENENSTWVGTFGKGLVNCNLSAGTSESYQNGNAELYPERNTITGIKNFGALLLLSTERGLWIFDKEDKTFRRPPCRAADTTTLFASFTQIPIYNKNDADTWLKAGNRLVKIDSSFSIVHEFDPGELVWDVDKLDSDDKGIVWFGGHFESKTGLYRYDTRDGSLINLKHDPSNPHSLPSNIVYGVLVDSDENVWVGTDHGISVLRKRSLLFNNQSIEGGVLNGSVLYKAKDSEYLVINRVFTGETDVNQIMMGPVTPGQLEINLHSVLKPMDGGFGNTFHQGRRHFWVGYWPLRIVGYSIDPKTGMFDDSKPREYDADPKNPNKIAGAGHLVEDSKGNLQVSNRVGIDIVTPTVKYGTDGSVRHIKPTKPKTLLIFARDGKSVWTMNKGGKSIGIFHEESDSIEQVIELDGVLATLRNSPDGSLLIGTQNGLYRAVQEGGHHKFQDEPIIPNAEVNAIQEDRRGRLWIYADGGIICFDKSSKASTIFREEDGVEHCRSGYIDKLHQTREGIMISAGPNGFSVFDPATFEFSKKEVTPVLTMLAVNNTTATGKIIRGDESFTLPHDISMLKELTIDFRHNNFTIEFSAMEMTAPEKNLYRHKLEGYDPDWIETDRKYRTATYTNLPAGEYTFKVKASNHHGVWSDLERTLKVVILPPPWKSTWAYTGYGILFIGLLYVARKSIVQRERLKSNLKLAKVEQEKEHFELEKAKEVDKVKSTFFANISHEFRTPLTLIKGPVQEMLEEYAEHPKIKERMKLIERNADLVLKLINQLLDLAKLESGTLTIEKSDNDLNSFLSIVTNSFSSLAFQKNISLKSELPQQRNLVSFDKGKVETILINLINNAIKFTPPGGSVSVKARIEIAQGSTETKSDGTPLWRRGEGGEVTITVSDTGIGIDKDQHEKIFERFHQVSEAHKEVGTGIGLSLVKELVALMKGTLSLKSEPGRGSEFTVTLPVEVIRLLTETEEVRKFEEQQLPAEFTLKTNGHESHDNKPRILVVEDNSDLRKFIIGSLGNEFHFLEAADGKQGLEIAFEETPDLIMSDVMMPEMDGITMTGKIKSDTRTSHIPLILLTAKTSDESKLTGLGTGADDYLTKPFNKNELLLKVRNSIALRVKLREKIKLELLKESPNVEVQSADEKFLLKVREAILSRLSDEQLSVESLADEIGLSRSQLFRKISALTGASVNELIRTFRLQKAAQLLEQNWAPVTQVAYEVGYSNLSYFSKAFKEKYGVSPSDYPVKTN